MFYLINVTPYIFAYIYYGILTFITVNDTMIISARVCPQEEEEEESGKFSSLPLASFNFINSIIGSGVIGK